MRLYTRTGDKGKTSLIGGRVDKDHLRVEAYGTLDEANSFVGQALALLDKEKFPDICAELQKIQHELFDCGGDLAIVNGKLPYKVTAEMVAFLETRIDEYVKEAPLLENLFCPAALRLQRRFMLPAR